ncbi:MAG: glycosyltransferase family 2 protein, partial [Blastocatellia bacterium]
MQGSPTLPITAVVPTYQRGEILVHTLRLLLDLKPSAAEILVVDQTPAYTPGTAAALESLEKESKIRLIKLEEPSITRAMN